MIIYNFNIKQNLNCFYSYSGFDYWILGKIYKVCSETLTTVFN